MLGPLKFQVDSNLVSFKLRNRVLQEDDTYESLRMAPQVMICGNKMWQLDNQSFTSFQYGRFMDIRWFDILQSAWSYRNIWNKASVTSNEFKWYPWKAIYYPETSPTSPCEKMTSLWHLLTGFPYSNCALQSSGEVWRDLSWTKLIITSSWEGWVVLSELISHDQPAGLTSDLYWNG